MVVLCLRSGLRFAAPLRGFVQSTGSGRKQCVVFTWILEMLSRSRVSIESKDILPWSGRSSFGALRTDTHAFQHCCQGMLCSLQIALQ